MSEARVYNCLKEKSIFCTNTFSSDDKVVEETLEFVKESTTIYTVALLEC